MKTPNLEDRKNWWLKVYACTSFRTSLSFCRQLLKSVKSTRHELYLPLSIAIHAFYGRPFKRQKGIGKLGEDFVPCKFKGIHKCLITFRDNVLVHTDAETTKEVGRPFHDIVYHIRHNGNSFSTSDPRPDLDYYDCVSKYLPVMIDKIQGEIEQNHDNFDELLPSSEGDYLFNIDGDKLFTTYQPPPKKLTF